MGIGQLEKDPISDSGHPYEFAPSPHVLAVLEIRPAKLAKEPYKPGKFDSGQVDLTPGDDRIGA